MGNFLKRMNSREIILIELFLQGFSSMLSKGYNSITTTDETILSKTMGIWTITINYLTRYPLTTRIYLRRNSGFGLLISSLYPLDFQTGEGYRM